MGLERFYPVLVLLLFFICDEFVKGTDDRIIGGRPAHEGEIPYQVSLRKSYNDKHFCGGVLITPKHVVTAAHCMYYIWGGVLPPIVVSAVFGQLDLPITENSVFRNASSIIIHPDFDRSTLANDLAIIALDEELPIGVNPLINTVSLREKWINEGKCFVSGWGVQEQESTVVSEKLLLAEVSIVDFEKCKLMYSKDAELSDGMLCAGHVDGKTDACQGDSGGPLICDGLLTGVVSSGDGCGLPEYPGVYSDVSSYYHWINNITTSNYIPGANKEWQPYDENHFLTTKDAENKNGGSFMKINSFVFFSVILKHVVFNNT